MLNVAIIGAGPAALAAAISIAKHCPSTEINVQVFEARASLKEHAGVQYTLMFMGLNALNILGLRDKLVDSIGHLNSSVWFIDQIWGESRKRNLSTVKGKEGWVHFERVRLLEALATELTVLNVNLHFSKRFVSYDSEARKVVFADGSTAPADLLVGADGINSAVRSAAIDRSIEPIVSGNEGYYVSVDFNDLAAKPKEERTDEEQKILDFVNGNGSVFSWGIPEMFGLFPLGGNKLCFFDSMENEAQKAFFDGKPQREASPSKRRAVLLQMAKAHRSDLGPDPCPGLEILEACVKRLDFGAGNNETWIIRHLPPMETTAKGQVVIIGDAAHAVPPSSGYGAQSSLEDGAFLGLALRDRYFGSSGLSLPEVLQEFSETRKLVIRAIQRLSVYSTHAYLRKNAQERLPVNFRPPTGTLEMAYWLAEVMWGTWWDVDGVKDFLAIPGSPGRPAPVVMRLYVPGKI
ncbi:hypothetical protein BJ742DRAFT_356616 [Cladochytrium replicatum]|nr:hypothetical protein BJ742DRAFT_356616 [Cladochytrium replicatum]